jgi:hypothetical protein
VQISEPIPGGSARVTEVTISALPEDNVNHGLYAVTVQWRGGDTYAVKRLSMVLGADGEWDYEPSPSNRDDDWIATHRFTYDRAVELAAQAAPHVTVNGLTVADCLARAAAYDEAKATEQARTTPRPASGGAS